MPWLHLLFDAWEDYKQMREHEATDREAAVREALEAGAPGDRSDDDGDDAHRKDKKKKRHKHKK